MLKKIFFTLIALLPFVAIAQNNNSVIPIPMKNGIVFYENTYSFNKTFKKDDFVDNSLAWLKSTFNDVPATVCIGDEIKATGTFTVAAGQTGDYVLKFDISISISSDSYTLRIYNFYENSSEKTSSHEFSKIEYRWRDFRKSKPWRPTDVTLFTVLDANTRALIASFEKNNLILNPANIAATPKFKVLAFFSTNVEGDHVDFAYDAMKFYKRMAAQYGFAFDTTSNWENTNDATLKNYKLVIWLNEFPHNEAERRSFEKYMDNGGAWLGFHVSGYNDKDTHWPWFVNFMGGAVFYNNNWPPLPAKMIVDDNKHPVTKDLPTEYTAPINEWYGWKPNPRLNKDVKVLVTLNPSNYPLGKKDIIKDGDIPVVWTNTKYKMVYMNMGHGDHNFDSALQNKMFEDVVLWLGE